MILPKNVHSFRRSLLDWYSTHQRDLPWRRTQDPYAILVSEFMLQQTQVKTVIPYYYEWLRRFPNLRALAQARESEVLHAWQGLGYYARARHLHSAAKAIVQEQGDAFPQVVDELRSFPGIGRYTANAIATFAFDRSVPIVDANIARVLARLFNYQQPIDSAPGHDAIWRFASSLVPPRGAGVFNSALMELGALVCRPRPACRVCPVRKFCRTTKPEILPTKRPRPRLKKLNERHAWIRSRGRILLQLSTKRWRGMWILPPFQATSKSNCPLHVSTFPFTNHRVTLQVFAHPSRKIDNHLQRWIDIGSIESVPIPSPHRRAINRLLSG